ncbi:thiamine-binding protein [Actinomyces dentalis]|uniref:thiamine-binding protein n=1 Tax=Actinomyces dentalis TaxID=272548 RepID=UPI0023558E94|nr:thiamine-binding protein [Actinomyces dentalis]
MLLAFSVSPATTDDPDGSVSEAVARAVRVVRDSGLPNETTSMFTTLEGEWDECMAVVKAACEAVAEVSPRVALVLKADIRPGWTGQLTAKVERVEERLRRSANGSGRARECNSAVDPHRGGCQ